MVERRMLFALLAAAAAGTFSIVATDPATGEVGVAVQSKYFAVGNVVPWAKAGVGAVATQASVIPAYGPRGLELLASGLAPDKVLDKLLAGDAAADTRQLGVAAASGETATFTGKKCNAWAGGVRGKGYAAQGNILAGEAVVRGMARAYEETRGSMAERLMAALEAAQAAGGDKRGQQSAALIVERKGAAAETQGGLDRVVDLRVDDNPEPIRELRRLLGIQQRWDALRRASKFYQDKDYARGAELLTAALAKYPDDPIILYDLACYESLAGRRDAALAHLRRSLEREPKNREMAKGDRDFAPLEKDPEFKKIVGP